MGVNLGDITTRKEIVFNHLRDRVIGVDAYNSLYQFLASIRGLDGTPLQDSKGNVTSHLQGLFSRSLNLMGKGLKLVYAFDGEPPKLKTAERDRRKGLKIEAGDKYREAVGKEDVESMYKYSSRMTRLTKDLVQEAEKLVVALGLPCVQSPSEADAQISYMCKQGDVYCAASMDYDCLLFGSPKLVRNLTLSQKRRMPGGKFVLTYLELIQLEEVLKELGLNQEQLISLGILVGTDFNIGGVSGIGPKKALKLVKDCNDFDKLFKELNVNFDWKEIFDIFDKCPHTSKYDLTWKKVDEEKVKKILVDKHEFNEERVQNILDKYKKELEQNSQTGLHNYF